MELLGRCHCGNIRYTLDWPGAPAAIPGRACTCAFCTRHGAVWTAHPDAQLIIDVIDPGAVSLYSFETKTADFWICTRCGVVPVCTSRIGEQDYAVVNVNALENSSLAIERAPVSFDGEDENRRLERRKDRWIGTVLQA